MNSFNQGYNALSAYDNPYWKNYPVDDCSKEEQLNARLWVDGYVAKIIKSKE